MSRKSKVTLDDKRLRELPGKVREQAARVVEQTLSELADEMRNRAPQNTGALASSIQEFRPGPTKGVAWVDDPIAIHHEYGTSQMEANPFIRPAARAVKPKFLARAREVFGHE
jgi:HK97 gp10 family phage protein